VAAVLAYSLKEITNETRIGVAREYYGDKSHGSHVTTSAKTESFPPSGTKIDSRSELLYAVS
jgi:hypothetical protein